MGAIYLVFVEHKTPFSYANLESDERAGGEQLPVHPSSHPRKGAVAGLPPIVCWASCPLVNTAPLRGSTQSRPGILIPASSNSPSEIAKALSRAPQARHSPVTSHFSNAHSLTAVTLKSWYFRYGKTQRNLPVCFVHFVPGRSKNIEGSSFLNQTSAPPASSSRWISSRRGLDIFA